jgi:hypothetical protein
MRPDANPARTMSRPASNSRCGSCPATPAKAHASGLRLVAVDTGWARGAVDAPQVRGRAADLIAALAGRAAALGALTGDGVEVLAARVAAESVRQSKAPAPPDPTR